MIDITSFTSIDEFDIFAREQRQAIFNTPFVQKNNKNNRHLIFVITAYSNNTITISKVVKTELYIIVNNFINNIVTATASTNYDFRQRLSNLVYNELNKEKESHNLGWATTLESMFYLNKKDFVLNFEAITISDISDYLIQSYFHDREERYE